jgi:hypothetical protein
VQVHMPCPCHSQQKTPLRKSTPCVRCHVHPSLVADVSGEIAAATIRVKVEGKRLFNHCCVMLLQAGSRPLCDCTLRHITEDNAIPAHSMHVYETVSHWDGLDGPGIESRWGPDVPYRPHRPRGPPNPLYNGYRVLPTVKTAEALS